MTCLFNDFLVTVILGPADFITSKNAFPVRVQEWVPADETSVFRESAAASLGAQGGQGQLGQGDQLHYAEPLLADVVQHMRTVFEAYKNMQLESLVKISQQARWDVQERFSPRALVERHFLPNFERILHGFSSDADAEER